MKALYTMRYVKMEDDLCSSYIYLVSEAKLRVSKNLQQKIEFKIEIDGLSITKFAVIGKKTNFVAQEIMS